MRLHRRKIAVIVEQRVAVFDTKGTDDNVGGLADRDAEFSQFAIIPGGARGQIGIQKRHESILAQPVFDALRMGLVPSAQKDFEQDKIADQEQFTCSRSFQFGCRQRSMAAQVRDPDRVVDENHDRPVGRP